RPTPCVDVGWIKPHVVSSAKSSGNRRPTRDEIEDVPSRDLSRASGADVDDIGTARAIVLRFTADRLAREAWRIVHLGDDLDVVAAVVAGERGAPEIFGDLSQVLGSLLDRHAHALRDHRGVALAQPGDELAVGAGRGLDER